MEPSGPPPYDPDSTPATDAAAPPPPPLASGVYPTADRGVPTDASGRVAADLPCLSCGYNLRGQWPSGACPECGMGIGDAVSGDRLALADPGWVARLRNGMTSLLWLILIIVVGAVMMGVIAAVTLPAGGPQGGLPTEMIIMGGIFSLVVVAVSLYGYLNLTAPEPAPLGGDPTQRQVARVGLLTAIGLGFVQSILDLTAASPAGSSLVGLLATLANLIGYFALMTYLAMLARRVPDPGLASQTGIVKWGMSAGFVLVGLTHLVTLAVSPGGAPTSPFPAGGGAELGVALMGLGCLMGLAFLVFGIWSIVLMFMYRSRFATAASGGFR